MSNTPICNAQKYAVVQKEDGRLQAVIPLEVGERLEADNVRLREALKEIADYQVYGPLDEWSEAAAYSAVKDIARAALAEGEKL